MESKKIPYNFFKTSVLIFLMFMSAVNYNVLINPTKIVAGGANGISIIVERLSSLNPSLTMLIVFGGTLIIGVLLREYELVVSALIASLIYPLFVEITGPLSDAIIIGQNDYFIIAVFAGVISGFTSGILCKLDISQGGISLITLIAAKKLKMAYSTINFIINGTIIVLGTAIFGISNLFLATIYLFTSKVITDKIINGTSQKKIFQIITDKDKEVADYITNSLNSGLTIFNTKGGAENKKRTVIMTSVTNRDYFRLKEGIHNIDKDAFVVITDSYQVKGGK